MLSTRWLAVLEDDAHLSEHLRAFFEPRGHAVRCFSRADELVAAVCSGTFPAVVLLDFSVPGVDGIATLRSLRELQPACQVVILSGDGRASTIVNMLRLGATDYVVTSGAGLASRLETVVREALERGVVPADAGEAQPGSHDTEQTWWNAGGPMSEVARLIDRVADCDVIVLICGESGVGKELVARAIHQRSPRARGPLVKINCAALPAELLESELFGHERGAFTGATSVRVGMFEQAHHGTILLDEIGEMSARLQAKLLHVLQDGSFTRLGSNRPIVVDARVLAATNRNLSAMMASGQFREDLYYRLKVVEVHVPPLRERLQELSSLVEYFLGKFSAQYNRPVPAISDDLSKLLLEHTWPGNVRELENCMKRLALLQDPGQIARDLRAPRALAQTARTEADPLVERMGDDTVREDERDACDVRKAEHTFAASDGAVIEPARVTSLRDIAREAVARAERVAIERALASVRGNTRRAAERLGVSYKTILGKIRDLDIDRRVTATGGVHRRVPPGADMGNPYEGVSASST